MKKKEKYHDLYGSLEYDLEILEDLKVAHPCKEISMTVTKIEEAMLWFVKFLENVKPIKE